MKNSEEILFYFSDLKKLCQGKKKKIVKFSLLFSMTVFAFLLIRSPLYETKATFRDIGEKKEQSDLLSAFFFTGKEERPGAEIMKSFQVMKEVIHKLGIQANVQDVSLLTKVFRRVRDNVKLGIGMGIDDIERFRFKNVYYNENENKSLLLRFSSQNHFEVLDLNKKLLCKSEVGKNTAVQDLSFTLENVPKSVRMQKYYLMKISSWGPIATRLVKEISIESKKGSKDLLELKYFHRDRFFACNLLNFIMEEYQHYLQKEHDAFAQAQLKYLEKRQTELTDHFKEALDDHIAYIKENLGEHGFLGIDQHLGSLFKPYQSGLDKLSSIDLQLRRLDASGSFFSSLPGPLGAEWMRLHQNVQLLQSSRDQMDLARINENGMVFQLQKKCQQRLSEIEDKLSTSEKELELSELDAELPDEIRQMVSDLHTLQEERESLLMEFQPIEKKFSLLQEIREQKVDIEKQIQAIEEGGKTIYGEILSSHKDDFADQLNHNLHLLNVKEKMVKEQAFYDEELPDFGGLDLETAKVLYIEYNNQWNASQIRSRQYINIASQIKQPDFELSSLSPHLKDPISQELIQRASQTKWNLEDEKNYSSKEEGRLKKELALHRSVLSQHIEEMIRLTDLEKDVLSEKLHFLQKAMLSLMTQKISIYQQQMEEYLAVHRDDLLSEKELLEQKLTQLKEQMTVLPQKWKKENELNLKTDLSLQMMKTTTSLVEQKTILHHLEQVASKPLDMALVPFRPKSTRLIFFTVLSFLIGAICAFFYHLIRAFLQGFEISLEALREEHPFVSGEITSSCDGPSLDPLNDKDLETLREMTQFLKKGSLVSLIGGKGPNYSHALAELMAKQDLKVLLIDASFSPKYSGKREESLLAFLEKKRKTLPIDRKNHYDFVPSGGYTKFANEYLSSGSFSKLLEDVKKRYDVVLLFTRALPNLTEAKTYLPFSDQVIVTVKGETIDELKPFIGWAHPQNDRLSFVMHS